MDYQLNCTKLVSEYSGQLPPPAVVIKSSRPRPMMYFLLPPRPCCPATAIAGPNCLSASPTSSHPDITNINSCVCVICPVPVQCYTTYGSGWEDAATRYSNYTALDVFMSQSLPAETNRSRLDIAFQHLTTITS